MSASWTLFPRIIKELKENQIQLKNKIKKRNSILTRILIGLGLVNRENLEKNISELVKERKRLLEEIVPAANQYLEYFSLEANNIASSNSFLPKEKESELLMLLDAFEKGVQELSNEEDATIQHSSLQSEIARVRGVIASHNFEMELKKQRAELLEHKADILQSETEYNLLDNGQRYFSKKEFYGWRGKWSSLVLKIKDYDEKVRSGVDFAGSINRVIGAFSQDEKWLIDRNQKFINDETLIFSSFFNDIESKPLTEEQKKAIITDEMHTLVVAGAGTGKTSTIIGKARYLLEKGLANPKEILLLSFNAAVADEMEQRLKARLQLCPTVKTYHAFGLQVIAEATGKKPDVSELTTDKNKFAHKVHGFIKNRMRDASFSRMINDYFLYHLIPYRSDFEFNSLGEYIRYLKQFDFRSMKGDKVKSFEECYIANFLYTNGIDFVYEQPYEYRTVDENHRQYKPDFYLPKYKIYIEHFGVDRNGRTAPFIPQEEYRRSMEWKRSIHAEHGTTLIETYHYEQREGTLLLNLGKKLQEKGVVFEPMPPERFFDDLNAMGRVNQFAVLLCTFINLYKSSGKTMAQIERDVDKNDARTNTFLNIFSVIFKDYSEYLQSKGEIDFNDMLNEATKYLNEGKYTSKFKYVLVDEFQDISQSRYLFLRALVDQNKSKLYCVGDDWQSVYRFNGSDVLLMAEFEKYFDFAEKCFLQETFRFNDKICDFSTRFILQNPLQLKKDIKSRTKAEGSAISVVRERTDVALKNIISSLQGKSDKDETLFVIGRYTKLKAFVSAYPPKINNLTIEYRTAHSSKGLEADYVVIIGLGGGKLGFPCQLDDDPVLNLVLAKGEVFPNAEERRLFYVAMTRAKKHVFLVDDPRFNSSSFIIEILGGSYDIERIGQLAKVVPCPKCKTGEIVSKETKYGILFYCNNYPYCDYRPKICPKCGKNYLVQGDFSWKCSDSACSFAASVCPWCNQGYVVKRKSRNGGYFYGCSNYPKCRYIKRHETHHSGSLYR